LQAIAGISKNPTNPSQISGNSGYNRILLQTDQETSLYQLLAIASGGAVGALFRFWVSSGVYAFLGRGFPYGTLTVNLLGSLVMGFLYVAFIERMVVSAELRGGLLIGFLGAFTTYSTFSIETLNLLEQAELLKAGLNILLSVVACLLACWLGMVLGRQL
jgi:CrcB protein